MTGSVTCEASTPARCAAPPAAAMITRMPDRSAPRANAAASSGVRCAEITRTSLGTFSLFSSATVSFITGQSESLPITTRHDRLCPGHFRSSPVSSLRERRRAYPIGRHGPRQHAGALHFH